MTPIRDGVARDLGAILDGTVDRFVDDACVVIDGVGLAELDPAGVDGWKYSELRPWTTFTRAGRTVSVGVRADMNPRRAHLVLFGADTDPGVTAMLLDRYHQAAGCAWRGTPAMTSLAIMRSTWGNAQKQPLWHHVEKGAGHVGRLEWSRELNEWESTWGWVHTFDANAAYLGSAGNAELAWGPLAHIDGPTTFDGRPGYWLIEPAAATLALDDEPGRPPLFSMRSKRGLVCVTTPYARLLAELGDPLRVHDAWVAERGSRVLRRWAETLRNARTMVEGWPAGPGRTAVLGAVKRTYTDATGAMQRVREDGGGMRVQRPDWAHTIIDLWRATLYRKMLRIRETEGVWPVKVKVDALSYADCVDDPATLRKAIGVRPGLGGWKHAEGTTTAQWVAAHPVRVPRQRSRAGVA